MSRSKAFRATALTAAIGLAPVAWGAASDAESDLKIRIRDETGAAGGVVQMKVETYEVTPISGGRPRFAVSSDMFSEIAGFDMDATGELAGAAVLDGDRVALSYATDGAFTGDYPFLTVALRIRPDAALGATTLFTFDPRSVWTALPAGPVVASRITPGTVTVGGSVSITDVVPSEGVWPAGTVVTVHGVGFNKRTRLRVNDIEIKAVRWISRREMRFTLAETATVRGARIRAENPAERATYYAYMRGLTTTVSARPLLAATNPIFSVAARAAATFGPYAALGGGLYAGIGLQNPNLADVAVGIALYDASGALLQQSARTLPRQNRLALELSELLDGVAPPPGSWAVVTASAPINAIGLLCDETSWTVSPSLPLEALR